MRRLFIALVLAAAVVGTMAPASAQTNESVEDEPSKIVLEIDNTTRVTDVEWNDESATVTLENTGEQWTQVTIYDISPIEAQGAHQIDDETVTLEGNETAAVTLDIAKPNNPQLSLSTSRGAALLVGPSGIWNPFEGESATWGAVQLGVLGAGIGAVLAFGLVAWHRVADRHDSTELVNP